MTVQSYKLKKGKQLSKTLYTLKGAKDKVKEYATKKVEITFVAYKVVKVHDINESGEISFFSTD
jgi:hypothetical protein